METEPTDAPQRVAALKERFSQPDDTVEQNLRAGGESGLDEATLRRWLRSVKCVLRISVRNSHHVPHISVGDLAHASGDSRLNCEVFHAVGTVIRQSRGYGRMRHGEKIMCRTAALTRYETLINRNNFSLN